MTPEEVKNNYEFKVVRRILMDKYNWITDVTVDERDLNNYNLIFLEIHVDLHKFVQATDATPARWLRSFKGDKYTSSFLSTGFQNLEYEEAKVIQDEMDDLMVQVRNTAAIPPELKLPRGRRFTPGQIIIPIPEDIDNYIEKY